LSTVYLQLVILLSTSAGKTTMADDSAQKVLRDALKLLPNSIHSGALDPRASATTRLRWIELGLRVFRGPVDRPATDLDLDNKRKVALTLKKVVPTLEKIRDENQSEHIRNTAVQYLRYIASECRA
jgi:hypothetical protein